MSASPERLKILETKTPCGEYPCSRSFRNWQSSTDDLYKERNLGPNPTVNHGQSQWRKQHLWILLRQPRAMNCFATAQRPCWLLVPNPVSIITWVFWFYYLWILDWNLQSTSTKQTPFSKVNKQKHKTKSVLLYVLLVYYPLAQRKKYFLWPLYSHTAFAVFAFILLDPSIPLLCYQASGLFHVLPEFLLCFH